MCYELHCNRYTGCILQPWLTSTLQYELTAGMKGLLGRGVGDDDDDDIRDWPTRPREFCNAVLQTIGTDYILKQFATGSFLICTSVFYCLISYSTLSSRSIVVGIRDPCPHWRVAVSILDPKSTVLIKILVIFPRLFRVTADTSSIVFSVCVCACVGLSARTRACVCQWLSNGTSRFCKLSTDATIVYTKNCSHSKGLY